MYDLSTPNRRTWWFPAIAIAVVIALMWTPVVAAGVSAAGGQASPDTAAQPFAGLSEADGSPQKVDISSEVSAELGSVLPKQLAELPVADDTASRSDAGAIERGGASRARADAPVSTPPATARPASSTSSSRAASSGSSSSSTSSNASSGGNEESRARSILAGLIAQHPILAGTTVSFGSTPGGYQAVAYYQSGRIIVNPDHSAPLDRILRHEIWHVIDWRDNGHIDWGESVPPK